MTSQGDFYAEYEGEKMGISLPCEATALSQVDIIPGPYETISFPWFFSRKWCCNLLKSVEYDRIMVLH